MKFHRFFFACTQEFFVFLGKIKPIIMKKLSLFCLLLFAGLYIHAQADYSFSYHEILPADAAKSVVEVESLGEIWVGTSTGIARYDGNTWTQELNMGGAAELNAYEIIEASDGKVWVALVEGGVSVYDGSLWNNFTTDDGLASNSNWAIGEDSTGNIWVGSTDAGVSVFDGSTWTVYDTGDGLAGNAVVEIMTTYRGDVWLGTANGVSIWNGTEFINLTSNEGLPSNLIRGLYQDFNGNIVVATSSGLGFYNKAEWTYLNSGDGLPTNNILDVTQMINGDFLLSTDQGLIHYDGSDFNLIDFQNGLSQNIIKSAYVDSDNKIWLVTPYRGVSVCDNENAYLNLRTNRDLVSDEIITMHDFDDVLWIGTDNGANEYTGEYWRTYKSADGLIGDTVNDITKEGDTLCFATRKGLSVYFDENYENYSTAEGLISDTITSVEIMADGTLYAGTWQGVMRINTDNSVDTITTTDGLVNDSVNELLEDNTGMLWMSTQNGISMYDGSTFVNAGSAELGGTVIHALFQDDSDNIWIGTDSTLVRYDGSFTNVAHSEPGHVISDIDDMSQGNELIVLYDESGNVEHFAKITNTFASTGWSHKTAINNQAGSYMWIGGHDGLLGMKIATEPTNTFNLTHPACQNTNDGSITINDNIANPPYEFSLDNGQTWQGTNDFTNLPYGQYHLKAKNALQQFTLDTTVFLNPQNEIRARIGIDQINCNGDANGVVELFMDDPAYTYTWSDAGTGLLRQNLSPAVYQVSVDDGICNLSRQNEIIEPEALLLSTAVVDVACYADTTGEIDLSVSGGTMPYEFVWSNSANTEDIVELTAGDYSVTVSDANGCTAEYTETVSQPSAPLAVSETIENVSCNGLSDGEILLNITGGTPAYNVLWNNGDTSEDLLAVPAGDYAVSITDANGCETQAEYTITEPEGMSFDQVNSDNVLCHGDSTGSISVSVSGGAGSLSYEWVMAGEPGVYSTDEDLTNLAPGDYTLTVLDENGCSVDSTVSITEPEPLSLDFDVTPITCQGYDDGAITALPEGGTEPYISYLWTYGDNPNIIGVNQEITDCQPGWYHVEVSDAHYCEIEDSVEIVDPEAHTVEIFETDMPCHGAEEGEIEVVVDDGTATGLSYQWSNGAGDTSVADGLAAGEFYVTITDQYGCELLDTGVVEEPPLADLGAFDDIAWLCSGETLNLDAGSGYAEYLWNTGQQTQSIDVLTEDVYSVFVTDTDDCEYGDTVQVQLSYPYQDESLCLLSVNEDNNMEIIWNKTPGVGTAEYNIYRENPATSEFELLTTVPFSNPGIYVDTDTDAEADDENYKLSVVDTCGNESPLSEMHSSIRLDVNSDLNGACHLNWDSYEGYFVVYYFIMRGTTQDNMQVVDSVLYSDFDYTEMNPDADGVFYQIMVKQPDPCNPGDGETYNRAYSNIMYCDNLVGIPSTAYGNLNVYPNPFVQTFSIDAYLKIESDITIRLYNSLGQKVYENDFGSYPAGEHHLEINDSALIPGLYHLQVHFGDDIYQQQIVKE